MTNIKKFDQEIRINDMWISFNTTNHPTSSTLSANHGAFYSINDKPYFANTTQYYELANSSITWNHISNSAIHVPSNGTTGYYLVKTPTGSNWQVLPTYDNYDNWKLRVNTTNYDISSNEIVEFKNGTDISLSYSSTNNAITITNSNPDKIVALTDGGTTTITGTYPNFTITSNDQYTGTVTSIATNGAILGGTITSTGTITHSTAAGYIHIPSGGSTNQYLKYSGTSGTAVWSNLPTPATVNDGTLTLATSGNGISGSQSFTANQSGAATFTVTSNATSSNTNNTIVYRDASGNFSASTITGDLTGNASTSTKWATSITLSLGGDISGSVSFDGSTTPVTLSTAIASNTINDTELNAGTGSAGQVLTYSSSGSHIVWQSPTVGTVTSISAGNGMNFTTITSTGSVTMGTPSSITSSSSNGVS
jgi:hypothetical protein